MILAAMERALRSAWWGTIAGVGALVIGLAVFLVYALSEVLAHPGLSLEDGYWIGRLPWTGIGEGFTVIGATVAVVLGTLTVWLGGNRWRRALVLVPLMERPATTARSRLPTRSPTRIPYLPRH